ncbi:hypothetical protein [Roseibium sp.]
MKVTVGKKIGIPLAGLLMLVGAVTAGVQVINSQVSNSASEVKDVAVPTAILTLSMLDRLNSMNSSLLEYVSGEEGKRATFS